jgi:hypothetical protein
MKRHRYIYSNGMFAASLFILKWTTPKSKRVAGSITESLLVKPHHTLGFKNMKRKKTFRQFSIVKILLD